MKPMMTATEVADIMDCSQSHGYAIIKTLNDELRAKGYITRTGRIPRKYFCERTGLEIEETPGAATPRESGN